MNHENPRERVLRASKEVDRAEHLLVEHWRPWRERVARHRLGLLIGGVAAAPFGAWIAKRVNPDLLLTFVGAILTITSTYALYRALS